MKRLSYIGDFDFTRKTAGTSRVMNCTKAIALESNFKVHILGRSNQLRIVDNGIEIFNFKRGYSTIEKLYLFCIRSHNLIKLLKSLPKSDIIVYYGTSAFFLLPIMHYCKKNDIKLVVDVVEWYSYKELFKSKKLLSIVDFHLGITQYIPKCSGVIAISTFFENYYKSIGVNTLRVPILVNTDLCTNCVDRPVFDAGYLNLIYAGSAGKKDYILNVVKAVNILTEEGIKIKLHLLGNLFEIPKEAISASVIFYGSIPQDEVSNYLSSADFSILIRPQERYANAGFPTKFVESLNVGLPVIANLTSDLGLYLNEGYNGYFVRDFSVSSILKKLRDIASIPKNEFLELRKNAKQTAIENFDYHLYSEKLNKFLLTL